MRALALTALVAVTSCTFAVKHPAATVAMVGGSIGALTCEVGTDFENHLACGGVTLGVAAALGGIVLLAIALGGEGDTVLRGEDPEEEQRPEPPSIDDVPPAPAADAPAEPAPPPPDPAAAPTVP